MVLAMETDEDDFGGPTSVEPQANAVQPLIEAAVTTTPWERVDGHDIEVMLRREPEHVDRHEVEVTLRREPEHVDRHDVEVTLRRERVDGQDDVELTLPRDVDVELTLPREPVDADWLAPPPPPAATADRKQLSLGSKTMPTSKRAKVAHRAARWLGLGLLAALMLAIVGSVGVTAFYMVSRSWLVPTTISATDDKVVAVQTELAIHQAERKHIVQRLAADDLSPESRETLVASLARQDKIIANLHSSPYLRALADNAIVALVPQANVDSVKPRAALYACRFEMFWCRAVGRVREVLPGEIQFRLPNRDTLVRGRIVELQLDEPNAARADVLFADGKPLGL